VLQFGTVPYCTVEECESVLGKEVATGAVGFAYLILTVKP